MGKIVTGASVSLDGYIAGPNETGFEHLFAWYGAGDIEDPSTHPEIPFALTASDHAYLKEYVDHVGVLVVGRRLFDMTDGWGGVHPLDRPVVVVTHRVPGEWVQAHADAPFTFVTDGLVAAIDGRRTSPGTMTSASTAARSPGSASNSGCWTRSASTWYLSCSEAVSPSSTT
jgi:dihydrofolate reductase